MNKILNIILATIGIMLILNACDDEYKTPDLIIPTYEISYGENLNDYLISIAELKNRYTNDLDSITDSIVITGIVIANDESGNLYKNIQIQDETGGIEVDLDAYNLYTLYEEGQRVYIECAGLYIGQSNGSTKLGYLYIDDDGVEEIGRAPEIIFKEHIFLDGLSETANIPTPDTIASSSDLTDDKMNTLVILKEATFDQAGETYANYQESVSRDITIGSESGEIIMYNSGYASFYSDTLPYGTGTITGVLVKYESSSGSVTWEVIIRDLDDVVGFDGTTKTCDPVTVETVSLPYTEDWSSFSSGDDIGSPWYSYTQKGSKSFYISSYNSVNYAIMSAYNSGASNNIAWLISPMVDMSTVADTNKVISLKIADAYSNGNPLKLYYSEFYDGSTCPENFVWTEIGAEELENLNKNTSTYDNEYESTGDIDVSEISGQVVFALVYTGGNDDITTTIQVSEVTIGEQQTSSGSSSSGYTLATSIEAGTYVIAAYTDGNYEVLNPVSESYSYGYVYTSTGTYSNNVLSTDAENEFTISTSSNGYYIQDSYDRYVYTNSSYTSFQVSSSLPSDAEWSVTINDDGTVKLLNNTTSKYIQYSTSYTSFGVYTDENGLMPYLFKKVE